MQQFEADGIIYQDMGDGTVKVVGYADQPPADPGFQYEGPKAEADLQNTQATLQGRQIDNRIDGATMDAQIRKAEADAAKAEAEAEKASKPPTPLTAAERANAITGYQSALALQGIIDDLKTKFKEGPGATEGLAGLADYLPLEANQRFDKAANAARGTVGQALGFTGGQLNSAQEALLNIGPFIPEAGDRDGSIKDSIKRLEDLQQQAKDRSVAILGGVPDQFGNVTQPEQSIDATQQRMVGGSAGGMVPSDNGFETVDNPELAGVNDEIYKMLVDGKSAAEIGGYLEGKGINPIPMMGAIQKNVELQKSNPGIRPHIDVDDMQQEIPWQKQKASDLLNSPYGAAGTEFVNATTAGQLDEIIGGNTQQTKEYLRGQYPGASLAGGIGGGLTAILPIGRGVQAGAKAAGATGIANNAVKAGLIGDVGYGAAFGAGENNDNRLIGAATGALAAGAGNKLGSAVTGGLGRGLRGVQNKAAQKLNESGVPLSLGQMLGERSIGGRFMNKLESTPIIGDMMNTRRLEANDAVFQSALDDAVSPVSGQLPKGATLADAQGIKNQAYSDATSGVSLMPDEQFMGDMTAANQLGASSRRFGNDYNEIITQDFPDIAGDGPLNGQQLRDMLRQSAGLKNTFQRKVNGADPQPTARHTAQAFGQVEDALTNLTNRQAPGAIPALQNANAVNARIAPIEKAMITANGNNPTPKQLRRAITSNTKKFGGQAAAARGDKVPEVVDAAAEVLPSSVPNSGTADRLAAGFLLPAALGGSAIGVETVTDNPALSGTLAALAALSTKKGAGLTQKALMDRPQLMKKIGDKVYKNRRLGGLIGAPALLTLAPR